MSGAEADELLASWRKTYSELFPKRHAEQMPVDDAAFALGLTLKRQFDAFIAAANRSSSVANLRQRDLDRIARHDPTAPE